MKLEEEYLALICQVERSRLEIRRLEKRKAELIDDIVDREIRIKELKKTLVDDDE